MPFPKTISELTAAGYEYRNQRRCSGPTCEAELEIWLTPNTNRIIPLEVDRKTGAVEPHHAHCKDVQYFRTQKRRT